MSRPGRLGIRFALILVVAGCAAADPERQARRDILSTAAQDCQRRHDFVSRFEFDRFDLLTFWYRNDATQAQRDVYLDCYRLRVQELTKSAGRGRKQSAQAR